ncbi:MAG: IS21-like element helper ATPase IstB [Paracoccaceae bacterium]|nr:IS21-like element helper ATPase IstB [Paracoccaceae bacterium]
MTDNAILHPLTQRIASLRLPGMLAAFQEQLARHDLDDMPFEDRLALLIDREVVERRSRALQRRLKKARLRHQDACFEDINLTRPRGLSRSVVLGLGDCTWIRNGVNILITGPCGTGKSWIACALAHKACLEGHQAQYLRVPRLLTDLRIAHGEGTIPKFYRDLARLDVIILDDWGLAPVDAARARDLLEILDDRFDRRSAIVTSQLPVPDWHQKIAEPTIADAMLDRLVHGAIRFELHGTSMRADSAKAGK